MGFLKKLFAFLTDDDMFADLPEEALFNQKSHAVVFSPSEQFPSHDALIVYFLNVFEQGDYEVITLTNADEPEQFVQVKYGEKLDFNIHYPFKDNPMERLKSCEVTLPESFGLTDWDAGTYALLSGDPIVKDQVAVLVNTFFTRLLNASPGFILSGTID